MFEGAVAGVLNRLLGRYVQDLDTESLNVGIFSGNVTLTDLKLKPEALYELDLPIDVKIGTIGRVALEIPWSQLSAKPVVLRIDDVLVLVGPAISNTNFDSEREKRLTRAAKRKILQDLEAESEILKGPQNFFSQLLTAIVNNIQIYVRNIHVRYEDSISSKEGPMACGLCLQSLSIETTNSKWKPCVTPSAGANTVYQMMRVEAFSMYWNPRATALEDTEVANITPVQYYTWKHYMLTGLNKFSMHGEDFQFLLKPVTCKVKVLINRGAGGGRTPRLLLDAVIQDSALQLSRDQLLSAHNLLACFQRIQLARKHRHLHPGVPLTKDIKKWWRYAYNVVLEQRIRPYSWASIRRHRQNYHEYRKLYTQTLKCPHDTELKLDLQKCEDSLPIIAVVIAREHAKFELLTQEPDRVELISSEYDWWRGGPDTEGKVELCLRRERSRSLWSHLSSPERKKLCELVGYVEGEPRVDASKQYIEHKLNLTLANCSLTLTNRNKEVAVLTLTHFLASMENRPQAQAYKLSARAESVVIEGASSDGELVPWLAGDAGAGVTSNLLAVDVEKHPSNCDADLAVCCAMEPCTVVYVEHALSELISFFQTSCMSLEELSQELWYAAEKAKTVLHSLAETVINRRKTIQLTVDIKGPCIVVPEYGNVHKASKVLVLDISRMHMKTELQPSNLTLEDATCMEIEERLYDRLHAEISYQVLFCSWTAGWREARQLADSALHLMPRAKLQLVLSNSVKRDYKLLPRYKLNISLSSFKLNLSDRIIGHLMDFYDTLPLPSPNTFPDALLDSQEYAEEFFDPDMVAAFEKDKVLGDPGYKELVKLRQRIVSAYMNRNRPSESTFDAGSPCPLLSPSASSPLSPAESSMETLARSVEQPGFDDNVSPNNTIGALLRFVIGEIVINLSRSTEQAARAYILASLRAVCLDVALMAYGPAIQLSVGGALLADKQRKTNTGQYVELFASQGELLNLLYRKVRADCPDFRSHFHSVEHALVADAGQCSVLLHADAMRTLLKYLQYITDKIQSRHSIDVKKSVIDRISHSWERLMRPDLDPPVPSGATKFSYSVRASSVSLKLCQFEEPLLSVVVGALESDCVFRANDRMIFRLYLSSLTADLCEPELYTKIIWPDEDKVLEVKYVRTAPRYYGDGGDTQRVKAHGSLNVYVGRLHCVLLYSLLHSLQQLVEPLVVAGAACGLATRAQSAVRAVRTSTTRLSLSIQIHAPVLLMPQKSSSPNLLVLNTGDLQIENFFKQVSNAAEAESPAQGPVLDNILVKLSDVTLCRAVITLAGTLELQEPILEPVSIRCDVKRLVGSPGSVPWEADVNVELVSIHLGQRDLATMLAVWSCNLSEAAYIGSLIPSSPTDVAAPCDVEVKELQAFLTQGEPVRKEALLRLMIEGVEVVLFSDVDEVLSSPVREPSGGLARLRAGEGRIAVDVYSDVRAELRASLQSLLLEDIHDPNAAIKRIFQSQGGGECAEGGISVHRPPLLDVSMSHARCGTTCDVRVDRTRLNLAVPFLLAVANTLLNALPVDRCSEGGVVNHGYVGDNGTRGNNNRHPSNDSTSGYYSTGTASSTMVGERRALSISIQLRQPEIMVFSETSSGPALLLRTELLVDYSRHAHAQNLVISLAGLQVMSKLQSRLKHVPPQAVLKPCDLEFSRSESPEGTRAKVTVSQLEIHLAASTVHTVLDIMEEISCELSVSDDREPFAFKTEKQDEDLWAPKKLTPYVLMNADCGEEIGRDGGRGRSELFTAIVPGVMVLFELEQTVRVPLVISKLSGELTLSDWSSQLHGSGSMSLYSACFNERLAVWEPLVEPSNGQCWELSATVFQSKSYPMTSKLDCSTHIETDPNGDQTKKSRKKSEMESETSADEGDTDNEMTFIRAPGGRGSRTYSMDCGAPLTALDLEDSDSENENGLMDKLATAISHLFTDDSSGEEQSNDEDSSAHEQSEAEGSEREDKAIVSFVDSSERKVKRDNEHKTVTLQSPVQEDSDDSGLDSESFTERTCTYLVLEGRQPLNLTITPATARAVTALANACTDRTAVVSAILADTGLTLLNDIGPGSTVNLHTCAETDLAGNPRLLASADYDHTSRPSTPGSSADMLEDIEKETRIENYDITDDWDCFEGGFSIQAASPCAPPPFSPLGPPPTASQLYHRVTDETLTIKLHDMDNLLIPCPQRSVSKLHVLHPSKNGTRYYIVVERTSDYTKKRIVVRSPLQIHNETSYALEVYYKKSDMQGAGFEPVGELTNPFDDKLRLAVVAAHDTYNVPLYVAYHCKLYLLPNTESNLSPSEAIWWAELANDVGTPRDVICTAKADGDDTVFALKVLPQEGVHSHKVSRAIPNLLIRVLPPLVLYNRLPCGVAVKGGAGWCVRLEAGERVVTHSLHPARTHRLTLEMHSMGLTWTANFTLSPDTNEKKLMLSTESETEGGNRQLTVAVRVERGECCQLYVYTPYWLVNKTQLPLQVKGSGSDLVYEVTDEPLVWNGGRGGRMRVRIQQSSWSRAARLAPTPGLLVCVHHERRLSYRVLLNVTLSELCPQLTKIVTLLPYFLVYNDTKRHLRYMEENEAADLWLELAPSQCAPFWPQTDSMAMHCKYRHSTTKSQHFPITKNHRTVLRMDKGSAILVEVTGGTDRPFTITFKPYSAGDAPVRVDNLCDDLFLKLHQQDCSQVALLSPHQSTLYTWDDPLGHRMLLWNVYNNKGNGFLADFSLDGYGEEKVSFHSVKQNSVQTANSVTSKLSSTLRRLTPRSPEPPLTSSSDDSDSSDLTQHPKTKKTRKDKAIVYWISYMEGHQRVFALAQDERIAYQYRMKIMSERSNFEVYLSLASVSLSVCIPTQDTIKELAFISISDSIPRWEVNVNHKWKQLSSDLTAWIEDKYQTQQTKCQLKEYIHIDLHKMQMTKPFFSELRRTYNPGVWLQIRKSDTHTYCHLKLQQLQIDNQLNEAIFPCVVHQEPLTNGLKNNIDKPSIEIVSLKQYRATLNQDLYKYLKVLVQEHCVNLDRGFVNHIFDILNRWNVEEKPAVRLRADLALVHMPLPIVAMKSQKSGQKNVVFDYLHLSPIKLVLSLSSRGCLDAGSPDGARLLNKREHRPKLFNSDLVEYLFNSWGASLCDKKDVIIKMSYLEIRNEALSFGNLLEEASRHYWIQLVQQFHALVLGVSVLGNPYSPLGREAQQYYDPSLGVVWYSEAGYKLSYSVARLLGHSASAAQPVAPVLPDVPDIKPTIPRTGDVVYAGGGVPSAVLAASEASPASVALQLAALIARPSFDEQYIVLRNMCREATRAAHTSAAGAAGALRARAGGRFVARRRPPRYASSLQGVTEYSAHAARGQQLAGAVGGTRGARSERYLAHAHVSPHTALLLTTRHIYLVRAGNWGGSWRAEWAVKLDDLIGVPAVRDNLLVLSVRQDELVNYFSTDEKAIEIQDPEVLNWMQGQIECALIMALEDKRCPVEP